MPELSQVTLEVASKRVRKPLLKRMGCALILVLWFVLLLMPCFFIFMATQGELAIQLGDIPGQSFRIWLINETRERGFAISQPSVVSTSSDNLATCMRMDVSFLLWQGEGKPTTFCECFERLSSSEQWTVKDNSASQCPS